MQLNAINQCKVMHNGVVAILCYLRLPDTFSIGPRVTHMQVW